MSRKTSANYSPEARARAVRMVLELQGDYVSQWSTIVFIASNIGSTGAGGEGLGQAVDRVVNAVYRGEAQLPSHFPMPATTKRFSFFDYQVC